MQPGEPPIAFSSSSAHHVAAEREWSLLDAVVPEEETRREPKTAKPMGLHEEQAIRCRKQIAVATVVAVVVIAGLWRTAVWFGWVGS